MPCFCSSPPSPVPISDFIQHVESLHKDSGYRFSAEYDVWTLLLLFVKKCMRVMPLLWSLVHRTNVQTYTRPISMQWKRLCSKQSQFMVEQMVHTFVQVSIHGWSLMDYRTANITMCYFVCEAARISSVRSYEAGHWMILVFNIHVISLCTRE